MFEKSKEKIKELGNKASIVPVNAHLAIIAKKGEHDFKKIGGKKGY